ncbi:hypothetical protein D3C80_814020 [compost metagenome]
MHLYAACETTTRNADLVAGKLIITVRQCGNCLAIWVAESTRETVVDNEVNTNVFLVVIDATRGCYDFDLMLVVKAVVKDVFAQSYCSDGCLISEVYRLKFEVRELPVIIFAGR